jgi:hypothetical protein
MPVFGLADRNGTAVPYVAPPPVRVAVELTKVGGVDVELL